MALQITYTKHALERMEQRRVSPKIIVKTIIKGDTRLSEKNRNICISKYEKIVVIYKKTRDGGYVIITCYRVD